ncbi:MAG: hypothetical protein JNJ83_22120 [Verrucomicrobiaceae bacterium]|nr:hypothetical protein [Verrucomicrobiaceae bacterium]
MKCSNCGAEMSNLNMSWGKKQLWIVLPIMLIGFVPLIKLFWFKGEATRDLVISEVQKRTAGDKLEIVGLVTNNGKYKFSSVIVEVEFFDASGVFIDEQNEYIRSDIVGGAKEHFKIAVKAPLTQVNGPDTKMVVKVAGGHSMPF